jgi:hypothetical protein
MQRSSVLGTGALLIAVALSGCTGAPSSPSSLGPVTTESPSITTPTPSPDLCSSIEQLKSSLHALSQVDVVTQGTSALKQPLAAAEQDLTQVLKAARGQHAARVDQVQTDLTALQKALSAAEADLTPTTIQGVSSALKVMADDVGRLLEEVAAGC